MERLAEKGSRGLLECSRGLLEYELADFKPSRGLFGSSFGESKRERGALVTTPADLEASRAVPTEKRAKRFMLERSFPMLARSSGTLARSF